MGQGPWAQWARAMGPARAHGPGPGPGPMGQGAWAKGPWARAHGPGPMGPGPWTQAHGPAMGLGPALLYADKPSPKNDLFFGTSKKMRSVRTIRMAVVSR